MLFRDAIELIEETITGKTDLGDPTITKTYSQVFADKLPINMSEKYQANAQGIVPEYKFKIRYMDYDGQKKVRYPITSGKEYKVIRTYTKDDEFIELTLQGVVLDGDA